MNEETNQLMALVKEIEALKQQLHKEYEAHQKEIALINEDAQITQLRIEKRISELAKEKDIELTHSIKRINELLKINEDHQKLNGELQTKLSKYEDKAAHYRRKAVL